MPPAYPEEPAHSSFDLKGLKAAAQLAACAPKVRCPALAPDSDLQEDYLM
jgi:hypothetical protein